MSISNRFNNTAFDTTIVERNPLQRCARCAQSARDNPLNFGAGLLCADCVRKAGIVNYAGGKFSAKYNCRHCDDEIQIHFSINEIKAHSFFGAIKRQMQKFGWHYRINPSPFVPFPASIACGKTHFKRLIK